MALAAAAAGADGVMVEVHVDPPAALSDGRQSLFPDEAADLGKRLSALLPLLGRRM
jgi:3-deoxy-7-phosphoheptulonate synthase